jgi:hypothetical protein
MDAIEHTASPFHFKGNDPQGNLFLTSKVCESLTFTSDFINPAVNGTLEILQSAQKYGSA